MKHIIIFLLAVIPLVSCGGKRDSEREIAEAFVLLDEIMDNQDAIAAGKQARIDSLRAIPATVSEASGVTRPSVIRWTRTRGRRFSTWLPRRA